MATLSFKGKSIIQNYHLAVKYHELIPEKKKSLTSKVSLKDNLIIHGDNLKALKALLPTYAGKVKCIYIDPPYNTGNENWIYNDNVNSPMMQEWLGKVVDKDDLTRHDKWLCMMMPRLKLLRDLLRPDGVIFISIDDIEIQRLKMLMDEIFHDNFITTIIRQTIKGGTGPSEAIRQTHDYVLVYEKNTDSAGLVGLPASPIEFDQKDEKGPFTKGRELNKWGAGSRREDSPTMWFSIPGPNGEDVYPIRNDGSEGRWRWGRERMLEAVKNEDVIFEPRGDGTYIVYEKMRPEVDGRRKKSYQTLFLDEYLNAYGTEELKAIFGGRTPLDYPKPTKLVTTLCKIANVLNDDIVLDSFAGSGTTAHAVLALNKEDGGKRKFILVECEDYANEITAERVRRVIKGVPGARDDALRNGLGGSFSFFELGNPIEMESILEGARLPSYLDLARYVFYTATGEEFLPEQVDEDRHFIGESKEYEVYLFYKPDLDYLKSTALTLEVAKALGDYTGKKKLVFAPTKYLDLNDSELLAKHGLKDIEYCQLPFEIYKLKE